MDNHELYIGLSDPKYESRPYERKPLDEGMSLINQLIGGYWKPRFLLDDDARTAVEFMNESEILCTVTPADIELDEIPGAERKLAQRLDFHYPSHICRFKDNVAEVRWQLCPDGMYYMDDDGFGMSDDEEYNIYGFIDRSGRVLVKFRPISDSSETVSMREEAVATLKSSQEP